MKISSKKIIIATSFLSALVLLVVWIIYFYSIKNSLPEKQLEKSNQEYCLADDEVASYIEKTEMSVRVSIEDKETKKEKLNFQIDNIDSKHYHPIELHRCGVYAIRKFNYDPKKSKQDAGFKVELWKYQYNKKGDDLIVLSEKGEDMVFKGYYSYDFRVDPAEIYVVLERGYLGEDDYALIVKNLKTKKDDFVFPIKKMIDKYPDLVGSVRLDDWSDDGRYFWFDTHVGAIRLGFVRIDTTTWKTDIFPAPENVMGGDALNFNTGYVTVHPDNIWFGVYELEQEEKEKLRKEGIGSELYIENLFTGERYFIDKTDEPLWFFKPKWISDTELEYYLPSGEKKVYKIISS